MAGSLSTVWALASKDVLVEYRSRDVVVSVAVFSLLVLAIFSFAVELTPQTVRIVGPGILWAGIAFAGVIGLNRSMAQETERDTLEGLMLTPVSRDVIFAGKAMGNILFIAAAQLIILPVFAVLFNLDVFRLEMLAVALIATIGFSAVGTLFAAMSVRVRSREIMLPMLFLPTITPLLIAAVEGTAAIVAGEGWAGAAQWLGLGIAFDVVFVVVSAVVFQLVLED